MSLSVLKEHTQWKPVHRLYWKNLPIPGLCHLMESVVLDIVAVCFVSWSALLVNVEERDCFVQLIHTEDLVGEKHNRHDYDQEQGHFKLLLVERFVVDVLLFHPYPFHGLREMRRLVETLEIIRSKQACFIWPANPLLPLLLYLLMDYSATSMIYSHPWLVAEKDLNQNTVCLQDFTLTLIYPSHTHASPNSDPRSV